MKTLKELQSELAYYRELAKKHSWYNEYVIVFSQKKSDRSTFMLGRRSLTEDNIIRTNSRTRVRVIDLRQLDRWISKFGADTDIDEVFVRIGWVVPSSVDETVDAQEGEERKKDTDQVSSVSDNPSDEAEMHGGEGNSGEVDSQAETLSEEERQAQMDALLGEGDGTDSLSDGNKECVKSSDRSDLSDLYDMVDSDADKKAVKRLVNRLVKIVDKEVGNNGNRSPRLDGTKLVKEMITKRWSLPRASKEELEMKPCLIMVDISGSCSASRGGNLAAALEIQRMMPDKVQIVTHFNGYPNVAVGKFLKDPSNMDLDLDYTSEEKSELVKYYTSNNWSLVINFGDADASEELEGMRQKGARILVLDSACSTSVGKAYLSHTRKNMVWVNGVNDATRAWVGLSIYQKNIK